MLNRNEIRKQMLLDLIAHPLTLLLITGGVTLLMVAWAAVRQTGILLFSAIGTLAVALATALTRFFLFGEHIAKKVGDEIQHEKQAGQQCALDQLERNLAGDGDGKGAILLSELRGLSAALAECNANNSELTPLSLELTLDSEQLYTRCVAALEQSHAFWLSTKNVNSERARWVLLKQRMTILDEVQKSISQFARVLEASQTMCAAEPACPELGQVRAQLEENLEAVRRLQTTAVSADTPAGSGARAEVPTQTH